MFMSLKPVLGLESEKGENLSLTFHESFEKDLPLMAGMLADDELGLQL